VNSTTNFYDTTSTERISCCCQNVIPMYITAYADIFNVSRNLARRWRHPPPVNLDM